MTRDRIFCPLKSKWFDLVKARRKTWEFRNSKSPVARQVSKMTGFDLDSKRICFDRDMLGGTPILSQNNTAIEFRRGYNGESAFGRILEIILYPTPNHVEHQVLHEGCVVRDDLYSIWSRGHLAAIRFELEGRA